VVAAVAGPRGSSAGALAAVPCPLTAFGSDAGIMLVSKPVRAACQDPRSWLIGKLIGRSPFLCQHHDHRDRQHGATVGTAGARHVRAAVCTRILHRRGQFDRTHLRDRQPRPAKSPTAAESASMIATHWWHDRTAHGRSNASAMLETGYRRGAVRYKPA